MKWLLDHTQVMEISSTRMPYNCTKTFYFEWIRPCADCWTKQLSINFRFSLCIIIVNHFYCLTNALNYTNLEVKIYVVWKFKRQKIKKLKITTTCFGSYAIHHQGVQSYAWLKLLVAIHRCFVVCLVSVWQRNFETVVRVYSSSRPDRTHTPQVQNYAAKHRPSTRQNICELLQVISVKHNSVLPDYGSYKIQNMSEWFLIFNFLSFNFYTT